MEFVLLAEESSVQRAQELHPAFYDDCRPCIRDGARHALVWHRRSATLLVLEHEYPYADRPTTITALVVDNLSSLRELLTALKAIPCLAKCGIRIGGGATTTVHANNGVTIADIYALLSGAWSVDHPPLPRQLQFTG